jgi:hypothetical protein
LGWSKDPGPPSSGEFSRHFYFDEEYTLWQKKQKSECSDVITMTAKLSKEIADILRSHEKFWNNFEHVIIYYDTGQIELTKILTYVFNTLYAHIEFRKAKNEGCPKLWGQTSF